MLYENIIDTPIGLMKIVTNEEELLMFDHVLKEEKVDKKSKKMPNIMKETINQLDEYFNKKRKVFKLKCRIEGTEFQKKVWNALLKIPYGEVSTYKKQAIMINNEKAVRAVGTANGKNKISIIYPCHRIIGSDGKLTGYAGGLDRKKWLLEHEKEYKEVK